MLFDCNVFILFDKSRQQKNHLNYYEIYRKKKKNKMKLSTKRISFWWNITFYRQLMNDNISPTTFALNFVILRQNSIQNLMEIPLYFFPLRLHFLCATPVYQSSIANNKIECNPRAPSICKFIFDCLRSNDWHWWRTACDILLIECDEHRKKRKKNKHRTQLKRSHQHTILFSCFLFVIYAHSDADWVWITHLKWLNMACMLTTVLQHMRFDCSK